MRRLTSQSLSKMKMRRTDMLSKLKKAVVKWFIPKPQDLADIVAGAAADFVNSSNKQDAIAKFVGKAQPVQEA